MEKSITNLKRYPYIKDINASTNINNQLVDITIDVDEETKTGNILLAGTFNADTGAGVNFGIEDDKIFLGLEIVLIQIFQLILRI